MLLKFGCTSINFGHCCTLDAPQSKMNRAETWKCLHPFWMHLHPNWMLPNFGCTSINFSCTSIQITCCFVSNAPPSILDAAECWRSLCHFGMHLHTLSAPPLIMDGVQLCLLLNLFCLHLHPNQVLPKSGCKLICFGCTSI